MADTQPTPDGFTWSHANGAEAMRCNGVVHFRCIDCRTWHQLLGENLLCASCQERAHAEGRDQPPREVQPSLDPAFKKRPDLEPLSPKIQPSPPVSEKELDELEVACAGASPGPWWIQQASPYQPPTIRGPDHVSGRDYKYIASIGSGYYKLTPPRTNQVHDRLDQSDRDTMFIIKCRLYMQRLIDDLRALKGCSGSGDDEQRP